MKCYPIHRESDSIPTMENISSYLEIIKTGNLTQIRETKKVLERHWNQISHPQIKGKEKIAFSTQILNGFQDFPCIQKAENQAAFISLLRYPIMTFREECRNLLFPPLLHCLQNPNGKVRLAATHILRDLVIFSSPFFLFSRTKKTNREYVLWKEWFGRCVSQLQKLLPMYEEPRFRKIRFVDQLPPSIYKSIQKVIGECFLFSPFYEEIWDEYLASMEKNESINHSILLSPIKLKYFKNPSPSDTSFPKKRCSACAEIKPLVGSIDPNDEHFFICEDCQIREYQRQLGFTSHDLARAHRRRLFDIGYLVREMVLDAYMKANQIISLDALPPDVFESIQNIGAVLYNTSLTRDEKIALENEPDQKKIEKSIRKILKPHLLFRSNDHSN